jgi:hypothetical protein
MQPAALQHVKDSGLRILHRTTIHSGRAHDPPAELGKDGGHTSRIILPPSLYDSAQCLVCLTYSLEYALVNLLVCFVG